MESTEFQLMNNFVVFFNYGYCVDKKSEFESLGQLFCLQNNCSPAGWLCSGECLGRSRSLLYCSCVCYYREGMWS